MKKNSFVLRILKRWLYNVPIQIGARWLMTALYALFFCSISYAQVVEGIDYTDRAHVDNTFDMAGTDIFGQRFPSEHLTIKDEVTGVEIIALTTSRHSNSKIYQTHPQWTPEGIRESGGAGLDVSEERIFFAARLDENRSAIYSVDLESGALTKLVEVPFRANHLQANPWISGEIMYCWETGGDAPQRIWYLSVDKKGNVHNRPVYKERPEEWVTHEVFMGPDHILFNVMGHLDRLRKNPTGIFSLNLRTNEVKKHGQTGEGGYWHADGTKDLEWAVGDTFNGNLYRLNLENNKDVTLLTTGHRPNSKGPFTAEAHSHHSISPDGKWVLFNSSMLTKIDIMLVPLHP